MKRTPLRRKTPLRAKVKPQGPRKPIKKRNPERYAKRHAEQFGEQAALCRVLPCLVCFSRFQGVLMADMAKRMLLDLNAYHVVCQAHHEPPCSCGGIDKDTVPLCVQHHIERHQHGLRALEQKYGVDLKRTAKMLSGIVTEANGGRVPRPGGEAPG